ncbi:adenylyltransferase/cytidyltransferase family protein [Comamonas sp. NLF-1-9]|uniref:adenylyltransferase/cytidyltransferase family protein n=1 Tax=Comamonas sp. NLF-1-9 TaxID=2853163 RepID=UPI001C44B518|nr:adenylyltransferase/cytidyltransferase family protein [Comamonas sp. NLF-1-9]QXL85301.1 adenylyltransferase/cytidyltransferase family protein [Comamonas sp. NLF-1-9]
MPEAKICSRAQGPSRVAALAGPVVFTNGVFDLLHRGHVQCLEAARALGGSLVVGVNSDASTRELGKGPGRPVNPQEDRAAVLAALECVSLVIVFDEATPLALLTQLRPDIYVKGGDYRNKPLLEAELMRQWGGSAVVLDYLPGRSTTALLERAFHIGNMEIAK